MLDLLNIFEFGLASVRDMIGVLLGLDGGDGAGETHPMAGVTGEEGDIGEGN